MIFNDHKSRAKKIGRSPELLSICTYYPYKTHRHTSYQYVAILMLKPRTGMVPGTR